MGRPRNLVEVFGIGDGHLAQRIKKFDRQLQFLVEKLPEVRRARASPGKKNAFRWIALLLRAIMTDRAHQFRVQPRHGARAQFLKRARHRRPATRESAPARATKPSRFLRNSAAANGSLNSFAMAEVTELPPIGNTAGENFPRLDKKKIRRARTDIDQERTSAQVAVVVAKRVVERHGREIDNRCAQTRCLDRPINLVEQVRLDRDKDHLNLPVRRCHRPADNPRPLRRSETERFAAPRRK